MTIHLMKRIQTTMLLGALAAMLPATASASIIFTNFTPKLAYDVTQGNSVGDDFVGDNLAQGDSFIPSTTTFFSSARLALSCVVGCPAATNFTVDLTADSSDSPGAIIESFSLTGVTLNALGNNNAPITVSSVLKRTLFAGTRYWITVSTSVAYSLVWNNNSTGDTNDQAVSSDGGATWFAPSGATPSALEVDGSPTPEPSTAAFVTAAGLLLMMSLPKKR
jgi:hypothetical protein